MSEPLGAYGLCAADKRPAEDAGLWLGAIVDASNDAIISKRLDGVITTWNAAAEKLFGYSAAEAVSQPITLIIPVDLHDEEKQILKQLRAGERIEHYETRRVTRDGRLLDVSITISPVRDAQGTIIGASKILRDITETKQMRAALRESERRLASELRNTALLRAVPDLMFILLRDGTYVDYNARDEKLLWAPPTVFLGRTVREIMPPALAETFMDAIERAFRRDGPVVVEYELQLGEVRGYFEGRIVQAGADRVLAIVRDLTEAKRTTERNRDLAGRLIASQEAERRRIARELHDDLSQKTALLTMDIEGLAKRCPEERSRFLELSERAHEIAADLHNLSYELHPSKLEALGLLSALKALCRDISQQSGVPIAFTHETIPGGIDPSVSLCLYRITQEALQNVARHSHAPDAHVRLAGDAQQLTLHIADSGVGFDARTSPSGLGLVSMRERAALLRGEVVVDTVPGGGTRIGVRVPFKGNDQAQDILNSH
jgi:PAS domain S-box-containing protein